MKRDDKTSQETSQASAKETSTQGSPGKEPRTGKLASASQGGQVQRKSEREKSAAPPPSSQGASGDGGDGDWSQVAWRPDLHAGPTGAAPVQRLADGESQAGQTGATGQSETTTTANPGDETANAGGGLENATTGDVETSIDNGDPPAVILQRIAELAAQHPGWPADCFNNVTVRTKIHNALDGDQEFRAYELMDQPPAGRPDRALTRFNLVATNATQASAQTIRAIFTTEPIATQDVALADSAVNGWLEVMAQLDPLTFFTHLQTGLNAAAATTENFFKWMVGQSSPNQILRALSGATDPVRTTAAGHLNNVANGWDWIDSIDGTALTQADYQAFTTLLAGADAIGQAKINRITSVQGPAAPVGTFAERMAALVTANAAEQEVLELIQLGTTDERLALLDDAATATFIHTKCGGHPLRVYAVADGERGQFLEKNEFLKITLTRLPFGESLGLISDRAYIDQLGATLDACAAELATWLAAMPAANSMSAPEQMSVRAIRLVINNAGNKQTIFDHFSDQISPDAWSTQNAAPVPADVMESPLATLDRLLADPSPDGDEIVEMCGAAGADRQTIAQDAARMTSIRAKTTDDQFFQVLVALRLGLSEQITQLGLKGHSPERLQTLINEANTLAINLLIRSDPAIAIIRADLPSQPLNLMRHDAPGQLPDFAMDYAGYRAWILEATNPTQLVTTVGATAELAGRFAPKFDSSGWQWITRLPDGAALLPDERSALTNLRAASQNPAAKRDIAAKLGDQTDVAADASTAFTELQTELAKAPADAGKCLALVTQLGDDNQRTDIVNSHKADALRIFAQAQLARFMLSLNMPLADQLAWLEEKGGATADTLQMLLTQASGPDKVALFDDQAAIDLLMASSELGPVRAMGGMDAATLGSMAAKQRFWQWYVAKEQPLELTHGVVQTAQIDTAINTIKAATLLDTFDQLPRGTGLDRTYRGYVDQIMHGATDGDAQKKMFVARFDVPLTGDWTGATPDDLVMLYDELATLPIAHVSNDRMLAIMNRHHNGGGTYSESGRQVNIGSGTTNDETFYNGEAGQYTEKYFDHTVRHEVGHAVDALMGGQTDVVFNQAGWNEYPQSQLDDWITSMNGWDASGGPAPSAQEKEQIKALIQEYVQSGGGTIAGPSQPASSLAGANHPWSRFPHVRVVREMDRNTTGMGYTNRYTTGGKVFSINYYYRRFMECADRAGASVPRDYAMFSPAEWFADMYAEYYREFDGVDDSKLGGNCPAWVKTWYLQNVHAVGGRTPHDVSGAPVPEGQRANH